MHRLAFQGRADHTRRSFERNLLARTSDALGITRKAARAVAAHLRFTAVGVVIAHPEISAVRRRLNDQDTIRTDAAVTIAKPRDLRAIELKIARAIVEHDEIIARAIHLGELQLRHGRSSIRVRAAQISGGHASRVCRRASLLCPTARCSAMKRCLDFAHMTCLDTRGLPQRERPVLMLRRADGAGLDRGAALRDDAVRRLLHHLLEQHAADACPGR